MDPSSSDLTAIRLSSNSARLARGIRDLRTQYRDVTSLLDELALESELLAQNLDKISPRKTAPVSIISSRAPRGSQLANTLEKVLRASETTVNNIQVDIDKFGSGSSTTSRSSTNVIDKTKGALRARKLRHSLIVLRSHRETLNFLASLLKM